MEPEKEEEKKKERFEDELIRVKEVRKRDD